MADCVAFRKYKIQGTQKYFRQKKDVRVRVDWAEVRRVGSLWGCFEVWRGVKGNWRNRDGLD